MAEAKAKANEGKKEQRKGGGFKLIFFMVILGCLIPFGVPTLLVCMGLLPTLVALFTDTEPSRSSVATIGYLNFAGVLPFVIELWEKGQTMPAAVGIIRDPASWVVMLGSAGMGHLMLFAIPPAVASFILSRQEARLKVLREGLQQLEAIWGPDVSNTLPLDAVRKHKGVY